MTTTAFKIILMEPAMGMYELMSQRRTPTTIKTITTWINGMIYSFIGDLPSNSPPPFQDLGISKHDSPEAWGLAGSKRLTPRMGESALIS
jgi:hypothetical protein